MRLRCDRRGWLRAAGLVAAFAAVTGGLGACSSSKASTAGTTRLTVRNFAIDAPSTVKAGTVRFAIVGQGPTMHELNIAETNASRKDLPVADDGTVDDKEDSPGFHHVAEAEGIDIGDTRAMTVSLAPGHYVLYCNMPGHYGEGMATEMTVTA